MAQEEVPIEVSVAEVQAILEAPGPRSHRIIDCREEDEWRICHIRGAELMPLTRFAEETITKLTDHAEPIIVYCHHGMRSLRAASWLRQRGYHQTQSMRGGIDAWASQVDPGMARY